MIWLSKMEELKKIIYTLGKGNLEFVGVFDFVVHEKRIVKLQGDEVPQYCLYLSTETGDYGSTVTVSKKKYDQARPGKPFGLCSVIRNIKHDYYVVVTEDTNPATVIRYTTRKSKLKMIFIIFVVGLWLGTILMFLYAFMMYILIHSFDVQGG